MQRNTNGKNKHQDIDMLGIFTRETELHFTLDCSLNMFKSEQNCSKR